MDIELTKREKQIVPLLALTDKQIANRLGVSTSTVRTYIYNLSLKLCADSKITLLVTALKLGLVTSQELVID